MNNIQVKIKNLVSQQFTHFGSFETLQEANDWINKLSNHPLQPWGKPSEYEVIIEDFTSKLSQEKINIEAEAYLRSTDWYVIRFAEQGIPYPQEIKDARQAARDKIVR